MRYPVRNRKHLVLPAGLGLLLLTAGVHAASWSPAGPIAEQQWTLMKITIGLMLLVLIPVFVLLVWLPWRYRATNAKAPYAPDWADSKWIDLLVWLIPAAIVATLAVVTWRSTHALDPYKPLAGAQAPLRVQAVSSDWKWLFIYPDLGVITENQLILPAGRPIAFNLTSATVMTSFFIPGAGSQIYAMPGMTTRLHLQIDKPGALVGMNTQYSGRGFPRQRFPVRVVPQTTFDHWSAHEIAQAPAWNAAALKRFLARGESEAKTFSGAPPALFQRISEGATQGHSHVR